MICDAGGVPLAVEISAGNLNERGFLIGLVERVADGGWLRHHRDPQLLADRGYDSQALRVELEVRAIRAVISPRRHHTKADGPVSPPGTRRRRKPRVADPTARLRWPVERTYAWLLAWRRVMVRFERRADMYRAVVQVAQIMVCTRILNNSL